MKICERETKETQYWLKIIFEIDWRSKEEGEEALKEVLGEITFYF